MVRESRDHTFVGSTLFHHISFTVFIQNFQVILFVFLTFIFSVNSCFVFIWGGRGHAFGCLSIKVLKFDKKFADVSISEKIQNFDYLFF